MFFRVFLLSAVVLFLSTGGEPCRNPAGETGCCSAGCTSWSDCLECAYDNYFLCVDQTGDTVRCTQLQDQEKHGCNQNCS